MLYSTHTTNQNKQRAYATAAAIAASWVNTHFAIDVGQLAVSPKAVAAPALLTDLENADITTTSSRLHTKTRRKKRSSNNHNLQRCVAFASRQTSMHALGRMFNLVTHHERQVARRRLISVAAKMFDGQLAHPRCNNVAFNAKHCVASLVVRLCDYVVIIIVVVVVVVVVVVIVVVVVEIDSGFKVKRA